MKNTMKALLVTCLLICSAWADTPPTKVDPQMATGLVPYTAFGGIRENVNYSTGNLNLQVPLLLLPGRDGLDFNLSLIYDSKIWALHAFVEYIPWDPTWTTKLIYYDWEAEEAGSKVGNYGWRWNIPTLYSHLKAKEHTWDPDCYTEYILILPDGSKHEFPVDPTPGRCEHIVDSQDGAFLRLDASADSQTVVYMKNGDRLYFSGHGGVATKVLDRNGNFISYEWIDNTTLRATDTLGREVTIAWNSGGGTVTYKNSTGNDTTISYALTNVSLSPSFVFPEDYCAEPNQCSSKADQHFVEHQPVLEGMSMLTSVTLPGQLGKYRFEYNAFAELTRITYPTGGWTEYTFAGPTRTGEPPVTEHADMQFGWGMGGDSHTRADSRQVLGRTICADISHCHSTTYTPAFSMGEVSHNVNTMVLFPDNSSAYYEFEVGGTSYEKIAGSSGVVLRQTRTTYTSQSPYLPQTITTTLGGGANPSSRVEYEYDNYLAKLYGFDGTSWIYMESARGIDNATRVDEYDYNGTLLRRTVATWVKSSNGQDWQYGSDATGYYHIWNLKESEQMKDATGAVLAQSAFLFDTTGEPQTYSLSGQQHQPMPRYGRANLTESKRGLKNADNSWSWLVTTNWYDEIGNVIQSTDPKAHVNTFSYTPAEWGNASCAAKAVPFSSPAQITKSGNTPLNGTNHLVQHVLTNVYNSCTGTVASTTDPNGAVTSHIYDTVDRKIESTLPGNGHVLTVYNDPGAADTPLPVSIVSKAAQNGTFVVTKKTFDTLGRKVTDQIECDQSGATCAVQTKTAYDSREHVQQVSNPFRSGEPERYTVTQYDALGRVIQVTRPGGAQSTALYTFDTTGAITTTTDEAGHQRTVKTDALGRIKQVEEPGTGQQQ